MTVEFVCEGCGWNVVDIVGETVPAHGLCATCRHICEHVPGPEGMKALDFLNDRQPKERKPDNGHER